MTEGDGGPREGNAALLRALEQPRYEVIPLRRAAERLKVLEPGTTVTITCSPRGGIEATVELSRHAVEHGLQTVPHIAARQVRDASHLADILAQLAELGIEEMFVPGGDQTPPEGDFHAAADVLEAMAGMSHSIKRVGITGYPEGHPLIDDERLNEALAAKAPHAHYIVTQMCFEPEAVTRWIRSVRERGITLPVYLGVPTVADRLHLLRIATQIGVGPSVRYLRHQGEFARRVLLPGAPGPDRAVLDFASAVADPELGIAGFHLYTFNQVEEARRWVTSLRERLQP